MLLILKFSLYQDKNGLLLYYVKRMKTHQKNMERNKKIWNGTQSDPITFFVVSIPTTQESTNKLHTMLVDHFKLLVI